ncbi:MAG: succinate dehydrogenase, cytochrome b556 subunit [Gammaproteobacteria bacterium]|nr:succinate dehydrogenase, cytochrome b556 subunit [Gammaproteobacteria bacterium]
MKSERPVNLNLFSIKWPVTALVSISHRVTGVLLFLATAALLYLLDLSLASEAGFGEAAAILATPGARLLGWLAFAALLVHLIAGCRHLLMDLGIGESLRGGRAGAIAVIALSAAGAAAAGLWLW